MHPVSSIAVQCDVHKLGSPATEFVVEEDGVATVNYIEWDNRDIVRLRFVKKMVIDGRLHDSVEFSMDSFNAKLEAFEDCMWCIVGHCDEHKVYWR